MWVNADHGRDLHPLADHMTKLNNFTKEENHDFFYKNYIETLHKRAGMSQWIQVGLAFRKIYLK